MAISKKNVRKTPGASPKSAIGKLNPRPANVTSKKVVSVAGSGEESPKES